MSRLRVGIVPLSTTLAFAGACLSSSSSPSPSSTPPASSTHKDAGAREGEASTHDADAPDVARETTGAPSPAPVCSAPQGTAPGVQSLVSADTIFAVDFYTLAVTLSGAAYNMIASPFSISATLTMVYAGAAGETASQLQTVLGLEGSAASVAPSFATLACEDETDGSYTGERLSIANSVWAQQGKPFEPSFLSLLSAGYDAPLHQVDFAGDPGAAETAINHWVSKETQGLIPALLQPSDVSTSTGIVLVDAIYFKGTRQTGFDPNLTKPLLFTLADGSKVQLPTMNGLVLVKTGQVTGASVTEVPYVGGALALDILLPDLSDGGPASLSSFEAGLTSSTLNAALTSLGYELQVNLLLPKFAFSTRLELAPLLGSMGATDLFDPSTADLSGMDGARDLYVNTVVHEATVEVDETGTVATAATETGITGTTTGVTAGEPPTVAIDHPFLFLIRDTKNGSILFMGRVEDPRQGS